MSDRIWYYANDNQKQGPVDEARLMELARAGTVRPETLVWTDGMENWEAADTTFARLGINPQQTGTIEAGTPPPPPVEGFSQSGPHPTTFADSVSTVFRKYADFNGRARRSEYWWFVLFSFCAQIALTIVDIAILNMPDLSPLSTIFSLAVLVPSIAVAARRLHDIGRSGWWQLLVLVPLIGLIVLIYWMVQKGDERANRFGPA